jgi:hypothetical protein
MRLMAAFCVLCVFCGCAPRYQCREIVDLDKDGYNSRLIEVCTRRECRANGKFITCPEWAK